MRKAAVHVLFTIYAIVVMMMILIYVIRHTESELATRARVVVAHNRKCLCARSGDVIEKYFKEIIIYYIIIIIHSHYMYIYCLCVANSKRKFV